MTARPLGPEAVFVPCPPETLGFGRTDELAPLEETIGQERAMSATAFGIGMRAAGYNLFVIGPSATGKTSMMRSVLRRAAEREPTPPDWCYVHNFADPYRPRALSLPAGRGRELLAELGRAVSAGAARLRKVFEGEEFARREAAIAADVQRRQGVRLAELEQRARAAGFAIRHGDDGLQAVYAPDGEPVSEEQIASMGASEREQIEERARALDAEVDPLIREIRQLEREAQLADETLVAEVAQATLRELFAGLRERFAGLPAVLSHIAAVEADMAAQAERFRQPEEEEQEEAKTPAPLPDQFLDRYKINLLVDRDGERGAPVVWETNPTCSNLVGKIEHRLQYGALVADFSLIKAGALHRANGGYMLLDAREVVGNELAWEALKRALKGLRVRIEENPEEQHAAGAASLDPEPIPLSIKVVLVGTAGMYASLYEAEEELAELFKVKVEFDDTLPRTPAIERLFARFVASETRERGLPPFTAAAVARLIEDSSRRAAHQGQLSARFGQLVDLLQQAAYWASERRATAVDAGDVERAVAHERYRANRLEAQLARATLDGEILLATGGAEVGQVNGLEVLSTGDFSFGRPFRITARARPGRSGLVDVERQVGLGGAIHAKGLLIIQGYLAGRYAVERPLAMAATLVSEQSYGEIEGDSASLAELCALLSSLSGVPLTQSIATTGSVNQRGEVQPVGGVSEKIEGFFDLCQARGLDPAGSMGVILPASNVRHLMLRADVVAAVREGKFRIWAVTRVDDALGLLAGRDPGERTAEGRFPEDSVNAAVERTLTAWADRVTPLP